MKIQRALWCSAVFFLVTAVLTASLARAFWPFVGRAPEFSLSSLEGGTVRLSSVYRNQAVLLVFWASWCPGCVEEIPVLNELSKKHPPEKLKILAVNVQESRDTLRRFLAQHPVDYPILMDETGEVASRYKVQGLPVSVVLAKGGEILYYGFSLPDNLEEMIDPRRN